MSIVEDEMMNARLSTRIVWMAKRGLGCVDRFYVQYRMAIERSRRNNEG